MTIQIELKTDKTEYEVGEKAKAKITLVNEGDVEEEIFFNNGQRYDFILKRGRKNIWQWSEDRVFIMATGTVNLEPGEEKSYESELETEDLSPGEYELIGMITGKPEFRESCSIIVIES